MNCCSREDGLWFRSLSRLDVQGEEVLGQEGIGEDCLCLMQQVVRGDGIARRIPGAEVGESQLLDPSFRCGLSRHGAGGVLALEGHLRFGVGEGCFMDQQIGAAG